MSNITMKELLEAGVHFGHQTKRWNPKMKRVHLRRAQRHLHHRPAEDAQALRERLQLRHATCGAERRAPCCSSAPRSRPRTPSPRRRQRCGMPYVNQRWLGGMLTNFETIKQSDRPAEGARRACSPTATIEAYTEEGSAATRQGAREAREEPRRHQAHGQAARRVLFVLDTEEGAHRRHRGQQARHPGRRHRRHQLRPRRHRLRDPRQRRRHPRHQAAHQQDRRRGPRGGLRPGYHASRRVPRVRRSPPKLPRTLREKRLRSQQNTPPKSGVPIDK